MRTTLRIDDDLLRDLKSRATEQSISLNALLNQLLRQALVTRPSKPRRYREKVFSLGAPRVSLDKALALAAAEEDEETLRKMAARK
jgi:hypothetical protein